MSFTLLFWQQRQTIEVLKKPLEVYDQFCLEATSQVAYAAHVAHQEMLHMADNNKTHKKTNWAIC